MVKRAYLSGKEKLRSGCVTDGLTAFRTRLERKQKAICESERRVREITTKLGSHAADGGSLQESSSSSTLGGVGSSPDRRGKKEEGLHSLAGGGDPDKDSNIREGRAIGNTDKEVRQVRSSPLSPS